MRKGKAQDHASCGQKVFDTVTPPKEQESEATSASHDHHTDVDGRGGRADEKREGTRLAPAALITAAPWRELAICATARLCAGFAAVSTLRHRRR